MKWFLIALALGAGLLAANIFLIPDVADRLNGAVLKGGALFGALAALGGIIGVCGALYRKHKKQNIFELFVLGSQKNTMLRRFSRVIFRATIVFFIGWAAYWSYQVNSNTSSDPHRYWYEAMDEYCPNIAKADARCVDFMEANHISSKEWQAPNKNAYDVLAGDPLGWLLFLLAPPILGLIAIRLLIYISLWIGRGFSVRDQAS